MPTYGCLIREAIVTSEVFFFMSPMQGFGQWYSVHEFLMQVVAPCSYHGCCQVTHVPCFEITLYLCHLSHVPFPHNISCFSCPQKLPTNPVISYHHSHCCPLPFRIAKTPCFCLFSLWLHFLVNLLLPAPSFQWPFPRQCPRMQQRSYHTRDDSSCFGRWEGAQAVWPNGSIPSPRQLFCGRQWTLSCSVAGHSARACVLGGHTFGCVLSCQASGTANHAGCPSIVMPKKLSGKSRAAQVFPRASHTVTRWHTNISRFSHSFICGVHNIFAFQLPSCHNHTRHVMFYLKRCTCPNFTWEF